MIHPMCHHELSPLDCDIQPFLLLLNPVVKHRESPDLSALQPHELISIINLSLFIDAGEEPSIFLIDRVLLPERNNLFKELFFVQLCVAFELFS